MVCIVVVMVCVVVLHGMYSCYGLCSSFARYVQLDCSKLFVFAGASPRVGTLTSQQ